MTHLLTLFGISFVGSVFWVMNAEMAAVYYAGELGYSPALVGSICASGQTMMYILLYYGGGWLATRWRWLRRKVERVRQKYGKKLETRYLYLSFLAGIFGVPPVLAMAVLAPGFGVRGPSFFGVLFAGRTIRFTLLAWMGKPLLDSIQLI